MLIMLLIVNIVIVAILTAAIKQDGQPLDHPELLPMTVIVIDLVVVIFWVMSRR